MERISFDEVSNTLVIDSKGICVMCFKQSDFLFTDEVNSNYLTIPNYSTKRISRFLKLPVKKLLRDLWLQIRVEPRQNSKDNKQDADLKVALCAGCASINEEFSELYEQMEKVQLQVDYCLDRLGDRIRGGEDRERKEWFWRKMSANQRDLSFSDLVEKFRKEAVQKCDLRSTGKVPRVTVKKLTEEKLARWIRKPPVLSDTEDDTDIAPDMDDSDGLSDNERSKRYEDYYAAGMPRLEREVAVESIAIRDLERMEPAEWEDSPPPVLIPQVNLSTLSASTGYKQPIHESTGRIEKIVSFKCKFCQMKFRQLKDLKNHITSKRINGLCENPGATPTSNGYHHNKMNPTSAKKLKAPHSPIPKPTLNHRSSPDGDGIPKIIRTFHLPPTQTHLQCKLCPKTFNSNVNLNRHITVRHEKRYQVNCKFCKKAFRDACLLREHQCQQKPLSKTKKKALKRWKQMAQHPPKSFGVMNPVKMHRCSICDKDATKKLNVYATEAGLNRHLLLVHNKADLGKPLDKSIRQCQFCKKFCFPFDLKTHMETAHGIDGMFQKADMKQVGGRKEA